MNINFLRLDEDRILVEQLRILLANVFMAIWPALVLSILLLWVLLDESNSVALGIWFVALLGAKLFGSWYAHRQLAAKISPERVRGIVWTMIIASVIDGVIWSALVWITLDNASLVGSLMVLSSITALLASAMSRLSAILPVFIAYVVTLTGLVVIKFFMMEDSAYASIGLSSIVFLASLILIALNGFREIRSAIKLRFENIDLLEQLKDKTEMAVAAQRAAEDANAAKSKFLAAASHDLRQPIHAQGLFLEVLSRTELKGQQQELLKSARAAAESSSELLDSLLDFSRIEAGVIEPQVHPFLLQPLFSKIESEFGPQARAKNLEFRLRATNVVVRSDPVLLERILRNLVANAIRYTNRGGLLLACRRQDKRAVIEIWDTGIGIAPEFQEDVFREFHQLGNPERDRRKGLGLGLAIALGLARTLEHNLTLGSIPQRGSVFRLALHMSADRSPEQQVIAMLSESQLLGVKVLVVDDEESVRDGMLHLLRDWGCESEAASSIEEALQLASVTPPDIVICDYRLREQRTGVEAIVELRALLGSALPALLITGDTAPQRLREAQASGVPLLHKPVAPGQLYRVLVGLLEQVEYDLDLSISMAGGN